MRAVVVGASSGLGRCIGVDLGRRGDQVALLARRYDRLVDAAKEASPGTLAIACDVTDESSCQAAIEEAAAGLGGIDALVYATGIGPLAPIEKHDADTWRRVLETNVIGAAVSPTPRFRISRPRAVSPPTCPHSAPRSHPPGRGSPAIT
ncbi:SDR family oxidoreductase [Streptomyces sp. R35]|uniref:SDR family oxidoreductase n=1 Tax=Streptomyces sp. R35 TaxID=3238630 RepID=A0AB39S6E9_9ACTN